MEKIKNKKKKNQPLKKKKSPLISYRFDQYKNRKIR